MRVTSKGQITIPQEYRERFGFLPHTEVEFISDTKGFRVVKSQKHPTRGSRFIERLRGRGNGKLSTDEIMKLTRG